MGDWTGFSNGRGFYGIQNIPRLRTSREKYLIHSKFPKDEEEILPPAELLADYFKKRKALDHEIDKTLAEIQRILGIETNIEE